MIRIAAPLALVLSLSACKYNTRFESTAHNSLSESERAQGMKLLFDGKSTAGWRGYKRTDCPSGWQAVDGALTRVAGEGEVGDGEVGDIVTLDQYQDFVLEFEWRIPEGANSGVMFHVTEDHDAPWETGPEFQLLDNAKHKDGLEPKTSAGANYAMNAPSADVTRRVGAWNTARIVVRGAHVEHWMNGTKIVEYELWSDAWKQGVANCKWKDRPDYGQRKSGYICLQDHGDSVSFRDIKIQRLEPKR